MFRRCGLFCGGTPNRRALTARMYTAVASLSCSLRFSSSMGGGGPRGRGRGYPARSTDGFTGERRGAGRGSSFGGRGGRGRGPPGTSVTMFAEASAKELVGLKKQYKAVKSREERHSIAKSAFQILNKVRMDPSSQDEKVVMTILNCAATFKSEPTRGIEEALVWARRNLGALSPVNVALFANALGSLRPPDAHEILGVEVTRAAEALLSEMTTVEVVMLLQAFMRVLPGELKEFEVVMLEKLQPCIPEMPISELSTLAVYLRRKRYILSTRNPDLARAVEIATVEKCITSVKTMHSANLVDILPLFTTENISPGDLIPFLKRAQEVVNFLTNEDVEKVLFGLASQKESGLSEDSAVKETVSALITDLMIRLDKVVGYSDHRNLSYLFKTAASLEMSYPEGVEEKMVGKIRRLVNTAPVKRLRQLSNSLKGYVFSSPACCRTGLDTIADAVVGVFPHYSSLNNNALEKAAPTVFTRTGRQTDAFYTRHVHHFFNILFLLESAYRVNGLKPPPSLTETLPTALLRVLPSLDTFDVVHLMHTLTFYVRSPLIQPQEDQRSDELKRLFAAVASRAEELIQRDWMPREVVQRSEEERVRILRDTSRALETWQGWLSEELTVLLQKVSQSCSS